MRIELEQQADKVAQIGLALVQASLQVLDEVSRGTDPVPQRKTLEATLWDSEQKLKQIRRDTACLELENP